MPMLSQDATLAPHTPSADDDCWSLEEERNLRGWCVEWAEPGNWFLSRRNRVYRAASLASPFQRLADFPVPKWRSLVGRFRLGQRCLRFMYYNVIPLPNGEVFFSFGRQDGLFKEQSRLNRRPHAGRVELLDGLKRPCRVLRSGACLGADGAIYFGEFIRNNDRGPIHIYRYRIGAPRVECVHTFEPGTIRRVTGVYRDPWDNSLWCLTGERPHECRILRTDDWFRTVHIVGAGDETWRAVSLQFTSQGAYYGMDADHRRNLVMFIDRATGRRTAVGPVDGPVQYSQSVAGDLFFGVTAKLTPSQQAPQAALWHLDHKQRLSRATLFEKDRYHRAVFMPGTLHFPAGPGAGDNLLFHCVGLRGADRRTYRLKRSAAESSTSGDQLRRAA